MQTFCNSTIVITFCDVCNSVILFHFMSVYYLYILDFHVISRTVFVSISSILYCIFILYIIVTNLALWLQYLNKLTYLFTYLRDALYMYC